MESISRELAASASLSVEFLCFLVIVFLCCLFAVVTYWLVRTNKNSNKRVESVVEETKKKTEQNQRELKISIGEELINQRFLMYQNYRRDAETIKKIASEAHQYLKSLANELMSRMEEKEHPEEQSPVEKQSKIDGKKSLKRGLEIQKRFTNEYKLTHNNTKSSLKKGDADIVDCDKNGNVSEVVAVKSFELEATEQGKTCRNVKGHKYVVSITPSRDAKAEVEAARQNGLSKIRLVVFNLKTGKKIFDDFVSFDKPITIREYASDT